MSGRKRTGLFLTVAGVLTLAASGVLWRQSAPALAKNAASSAVLEDSLKHVHEQAVQVGLKIRGLQESEATIPDTVKVYGAGKMVELSNTYAKTIRKLDMTERDIKLEMASLKRDSERQRAAAKQRALPLAAAGAVACLVGIVLAALPGRRVGA